MAVQTLKDYLVEQKCLADVVLPPAIDRLLTSLIINGQNGLTGTVTPGSAIPLFLGMQIPVNAAGPVIPYALTAPDTSVTPPNAFSLLLDLAAVTPVDTVLSLLDVATTPLVPATPVTGLAAGEEALVKADGVVKLTGAGFGLIVEAPSGGAARLRLSLTAVKPGQPAPAQPPGIVDLGLQPRTVLIGDTGYGIGLDDPGLTLDLSDQNAPANPAKVEGVIKTLASDTKAWRGLSIRNARLYLPADVPIFGKTACDLNLDIGLAPAAGINLTATAHAVAVPGSRPAMTLRIECVDPAATGLASFVPTLVEATVEIAVSDTQPVAATGGETKNLSLLTGKIIARARFSRAAATGDGKTRLSIALEAQDGGAIATIRPKDADDTVALYAIGAAGFATALIAYQNKGGGQSFGMASLMIGGGLVAALLASNDGAAGQDPQKAKDLIAAGRVRLNAVELAASGPGWAIGDQFELLLDYSVDVPIRPVRIGSLSIGLDPTELLRLRLRNVSVTFNPAAVGLDRFAVDFKHATTDVEDPGHWLVDGGVGNLFDVIGTRSGRGSLWFEIDLRFKVDLGPIRVSGATLRVTLDDAFRPSVAVRGLEASLIVPGVLKVKGGIKIGGTDGGAGFSASLAATIIPLGGLGAEAYLEVTQDMVLLHLTCDLPAPIPIAATGFGLYGLRGTFGLNARPKPLGSPFELLAWKPEGGFVPRTGDMSFGVEASVGTLADRAFSLAAKAGLFLTVPDVQVLGALDAAFFKGPADANAPVAQQPSVSVRGGISVKPGDRTAFALAAHAGIPQLVDIDVPVAGNFPTGSNDWYVYVGADGVNKDGREIGPARMTVLPQLLGLKANAYLMLRGAGLTDWPPGKSGTVLPPGFVIAFGFSTSFSFGVRPIAYAEVSGGADIAIATGPLVIAGFGHIEGSFHLGPVSLGVSATLTVLIQDGQAFIKAEVCGRIHLLFITIHRCATISFGAKPTLSIPPPASLPIERQTQRPDGSWVTGLDIGLMTDRYRQTGSWALSAGTVPTVWPDTLIRIGFAWAPEMGTDWTKQFNKDALATVPPQPVGSAYLSYRWRVDTVRFRKQVSGGAWQDVAGPLSAAWQVGKLGPADGGAPPIAGQPGTVAQPVELVLLSPAPAIWTERLDSTAGQPYDPMPGLAASCRVRIAPKPGWLLGGMAQHPASLCTLPPEAVSADPVQSRVAGRMRYTVAGSDGKPVALTGLLTKLPATWSFVPPGILKGTWTTLRTFDGSLFLPCVVMPPMLAVAAVTFRTPQLTAMLTLDDPIVDGMMWLACGKADLTPDQVKAGMVTVSDETGDWPLQLYDSGTGPTHRLGFALPVGRNVRRIAVRYDYGVPVALLGLSGTTAKAQAAAAKAQAAGQAKADQLGKAAAAKPGDTNSADTRCLLEPDTLYAVDIGLAWTAERFTQDEAGNTISAGTGQGSASRTVSFRTAKAYQGVAGETATDPAAATGDAAHRRLFLYEDVFDPAMLVRFQAGSEPAQGEVDRFWGDPIRFHWSAGHVARLAALYGFALEIVVQRTDIGGDAGAVAVSAQRLVKATNPRFLKGAAARLQALSLTTACPVPFDGATSDVPVVLAPRAWYEAYPRVRLASGSAVATRLPGATFRTSRWKNAADMVGGIGFPASGLGASAGDLPVPASGGAIGTMIANPRGDAAFDDALRTLGLDRWPVAAEPRVSLLWSKAAGGWALTGAMIEAPEPIERDGRTAGARLLPQLAPGTPGGFEVKVVDRSGSRLLFLTATPFVPKAWPAPAPGPLGPIVRPRFNRPSLVLQLDDLPFDGPKATLSGTLALPTSPSFANEAF